MEDRSPFTCENCGEKLIARMPVTQEFGGGMAELHFCPTCNTRLPKFMTGTIIEVEKK